MRTRIKGIILGILSSASAVASTAMPAEIDSTIVTVDYPLCVSTLSPDFEKNREKLETLTEKLQSLTNDSTVTISSITFRGNASPEGPADINHRLSRQRMLSLEKYLCNQIDIPDSLIIEEDGYVAWDQVTTLLEESDYSFRDKALEIIRGEYHTYTVNSRKYDSRVRALRRLNGGSAWPIIYRDIFCKVRNASAIVRYSRNVIAKPEAEITTPEIITEEPAEEEPTDTTTTLPEEEEEEVTVVVADKHKHLYLKSNAVGWAMLIANLGIEVEVADHWSVAVSGYYSALDYFKETLKFRTAAIQPEVRYWFSAPQQGWFTAAHLGLAWWNYALDGKYRRQDHNGKSPAYGGGVNFGYRKNISRHWDVEFSAGAGVYRLNYDKFLNGPNGQLIESSIRRTWFGIDNLAITFSYSFDLNNR